ncbi:hypothetical protein [Lusitaniella coriacea]|uniref:hypothetical protein n=1 Tax=Lusitaniella coriacea TaxID=1983105 RepID=UPI003CEA4CE5
MKSLESQSRFRVSLSPTAIDGLGRMAKETGLSRSALVEQIVSGAIAVASPSAKTTIALQKIQTPERVEEIEINIISQTQEASNETSRTQQTKEENRAITQLKSELAQLQQQFADLQHQLSQHQVLNDRQTQINQALRQNNKSQAEQIVDSQEQLKEKKLLISHQNEIAQSRQDELAKKSIRIDELQQDLEILTAQCVLPDDAQQLIQKQSNQIESLEQEITQLQHLARFGEMQINKWRYRTFRR